MTAKFTAIPTEYAGVKFKSRLEARFAEYLDSVPTKWEYEPEFPGSYVPDFFLTDLNVLVEIKPRVYLKEIGLFRDQIESCGVPWVCIDSIDRDKWTILKSNKAFSGVCTFHSEYINRFRIFMSRCSDSYTGRIVSDDRMVWIAVDECHLCMRYVSTKRVE